MSADKSEKEKKLEFLADIEEYAKQEGFYDYISKHLREAVRLVGSDADSEQIANAYFKLGKRVGEALKGSRGKNAGSD